jgi:hypothetical protein
VEALLQEGSEIMEEKFFIEKFVQHEDRFGIKVRSEEGNEGWINGFGKCPLEIESDSEMVIPFHVVTRGDKTYYNFGEEKKKVTVESLSSSIEAVKEELKVIRGEIEELYAALKKA